MTPGTFRSVKSRYRLFGSAYVAFVVDPGGALMTGSMVEKRPPPW
jgi:hypothetical protein